MSMKEYEMLREQYIKKDNEKSNNNQLIYNNNQNNNIENDKKSNENKFSFIIFPLLE